MPKAIPIQEGPQPDDTTWKLVNGKMRLIARRPEWPEQDAKDKKAYGLPPGESLSVNEFLEVHPEESSEHGFRRGYDEGWMHAIETFMNIVQEGATPMEAYKAMYRFGRRHGPLQQWVAGDCRQMRAPPILSAGAALQEITERRQNKPTEQEE